MPSFVAYSISPFGTGTIETGAGNITITSGVATLTVEQTGNIGVGVAIEYDTEDISYIAPNRIGFDSGGTAELLPDTKIEDATSGATGIVRFVELLSGTWAGGDAAGWIYFEKTTGTFGDDNQINRTKPTTSDNIATVNGTIEGNIGNGNTEFVVKSAIGADAADQTITAVTSIHHEYASLAAFEAGFTDATHVNNVALTTADVVAHACFYYDHDNYTVDSAQLLLNWGGTTDATRYLFIFSPNGDAESINRQSHLGIWDTEKAILEFEVTVSNQSVIEITEDYVRIKSLQASMLDGGSIIKNYNRVIYTIASSVLNYRLVDSCILKNSGAPIGSKYLIETDDADTILDIINTVVYYGDGDHYGNAVFLDHCTTVNIFHCTVYGSLDMDGIERDEGTVTTTNTVSFHNLDDFDGTQTITFCASDDEDGSDSQLLDSSGTPAYDTEFTDAAGGDFSLPVGSICIDNGTSLAASQGIWRDIAGNERGATPDIGAFEYVAPMTGSAALTGTAVVDGVLESEIVTGGQTIIITLTDDTWIAAGTGPIGTDANTQALIDGIDGDVAGGTGWDEKVQSTLVPDDDVVRGSDTECTITLNAAADYAITSDETITVTIPAEVLTGGVEITADATFVVTNETPEEAAPISSVGTITAAGEKVGDLASGIATTTFSLKKSTATFTLKKPTATFS